MQTITIGSNTYNLCAMPSTPAPASIEIGMNDTVAVNTSPFTRAEQTQRWPSGDFWDSTVTLPPMTWQEAAAWEGFLAELQGRGNVLQLGDPRKSGVQGTALGTPVVNTTGSNNIPGTTALETAEWQNNENGLLLPGDRFQVGLRLYMVCESVSSDASGIATITVWPSIRETPANATPLVLTSPQGLFRLATNRRALQASPARGTMMSFKCTEAR